MTRLCKLCGSRGPFYASQGAWKPCIACLRRQYQARELARLAAIPPAQRTRRDTIRLLHAQCGPYRRVCRWCWLAKGLRCFARHPTQSQGRDPYCKECRRILDRLRRQRRRAAQHEDTPSLPQA